MKILQFLIALDQILNTLLGGYADETLSARAYRLQDEKKRWKVLRQFIDSIFFWEDRHCYNSYLSEIERRQYPSVYRSVQNKLRGF